MKKSLFYIAAMLLAVGCNNDEVEDFGVVGEESLSAETTFVNLNLGFEESYATRISVVTGETDADDWTATWEYGDQIFVYSIERDSYKTLSFDGTSFSGEVYTGDNRIYHKYQANNLNIQEVDGTKYVALKANTTLFSDGGSPTVISKDVLVFDAEADETETSESIDVVMNQVGAAIDLRLKFSALIEGVDLTLTEITLGGVPDGESEDDYTLVPYQIWTDVSAGVDDTDFVYKSEDWDRCYGVSMDITETNTEYSVQFATLPFSIEAGKKLNVTLRFNYNDTLTKSFDVAPTNGFTFTRGTHSYLEYKIDLSEIFEGTWLSKATAFADTASEGTDGDPIEISTAEELAYLSLITMADSYSTDGVYYKLINDIDLSGSEWYPIGRNNHFRGHFDGNSKTISNLTIDSSNNYTGLFGYISDASVSNINLVDAQISGYSYRVGSIAAETCNSTVTDCSNTGTNASISIISSEYVGGIVGRVDYYSTIKKCYNTVNISGGNNIGGIVGELCEASEVVQCYNTGAVKGDYQVGGVVGRFWSSTITACYNTGAVTANNYEAGGVVGYISYDSNYEQKNVITSCYNVGSVSASNTERIGNIVGYDEDSSYTTITQCYYLPASLSLTDSYGGVSLSSVLDLNKKVTDMNTAADYDYYTARGSTTLPSLMGEAITFEYTEPVDQVDDLSSNGGVTSDDYDE